MSIYQLHAGLLTELVVQSDNPNLALANPRLFDLVHDIMPRRLVQALIAHDQLERLDQLRARYHIEYGVKDLITALKAGSLRFVQRYYSSIRQPADALAYASSSGNLELVMYVWARQPKDHHLANTERAFRVAVRYGHLAVAQYLYRRALELGGFSSAGQETLWTALEAAGDSGNLELLRWLIDRLRIEAQTEDHQVDPMRMLPSGTIRGLIIHGHYDTLKWLLDHGYFADPEERYTSYSYGYSFYDVAYGTGRPDLIELMAQYDGDSIESPGEALTVALTVGNAAAIDEFFDDYQGYVGSVEHERDQLAANGHLAALKVLAAHGVKMDKDVLQVAASNGQVDVVKWLLVTVEFRPKTLLSTLDGTIKWERPAIFKVIQEYLDPAALYSVIETVAEHGSAYLMDQLFRTLGAENINRGELLRLARQKNNLVVVEYLESLGLVE